MGKQPDVLLLDEPVAALDPLARREVLRSLTLAMTERPMTMLLSSHLLPDLERVCDHLIVMADGRAVLADDVDEIRRTHKLVHLPLVSLPVLASQHEVISEERDGTHASVLARLDGPVLDPAWEIADVSLEEIVLGHLGRPPMPAKPQARPTMGVVR
jgi:ABC-2 type transport system ATP-binding protein